MTKQIAIIQGHPDAQHHHFGHALAEAYAEGAATSGNEVAFINVAKIDFPLLRSKEDFEHGVPPASIQQAQQTLKQADHLVIIYPLWLGAMPALLKGFFEQVFRPSFISDNPETGKAGKRLLKGKSARIVVTMGMPAFAYRWFYRAHSLKNLERNILSFCGIGPIKESLIGMIEAEDDAGRKKWIEKMRTFGSRGE